MNCHAMGEFSPGGVRSVEGISHRPFVIPENSQAALLEL
jgi:hypothetical protein